MKTVLATLFFILCITIASEAQNDIGGKIWKISNGIIETSGNRNDSIAITYWDYLNAVLPNKMLKKYITNLRLFSDGEKEILGGMYAKNNTSEWEISIDTIDFNFRNKNTLFIRDYTHTIIHEFGHLLTLNSTQIEATNDNYQDDKKGYLTLEGYATKPL